MNYQCIVCGAVLYKSTPHREDTTLTDHRNTAHPGVKPSIPLSELYRKHQEVEPDAG